MIWACAACVEERVIVCMQHEGRHRHMHEKGGQALRAACKLSEPMAARGVARLHKRLCRWIFKPAPR